jgi:hypothetical protein
LHAVLAKGKRSQRNAHISSIHKQHRHSKTPRAKTKTKKYSPISKPTPANGTPLIKTGMAASSNGLFASEVNTKDGFPK